MRTGWMLVAAALCACGGDDKQPTKPAAGRGAEDAGAVRDAGKPDAGHDSGTEPNELGGQGGADGTAEAGSGGAMPTGGMVAGGSGGSRPPDPRPEGGAGGSQAPQERVLWSKDITVEVHSALGYGALEGDQMGLRIETDKFGCTVGDEPQPSGTTREYAMDASCLTKFARTTPLNWAVLFYHSTGESAGVAKREELDWSGVDGKTVTKLRRTQTWTLDRICDTTTTCWHFADFTGKWEVLGY